MMFTKDTQTELKSAAQNNAEAMLAANGAAAIAAAAIMNECKLKEGSKLELSVWMQARGYMQLGYMQGYNKKAGIKANQKPTEAQIEARDSAFETFASRVKGLLKSSGVEVLKSKTEGAKKKAAQRTPEAMAKKAKEDKAAHAKVAAVIEKEGGAPLVAALQAAKGDESQAKKMQAAYLRVEKQEAKAAREANKQEIDNLAKDLREAITTAVKEGDIDYLRQLSQAL